MGNFGSDYRTRRGVVVPHRLEPGPQPGSARVANMKDREERMVEIRRRRTKWGKYHKHRG